MTQSQTRAGHVAILGFPNAGKSTLLNRFLDTKLSIVSSAAQTTRERVVGIDTAEDFQIVFLDTPGLVEPSHLLHRSMLHAVEQAIRDADVLVLLFDSTRPLPDLPPSVSVLLGGRAADLLVCLSKVDLAERDVLETATEAVVSRWGKPPLLVSATTGSGVDELRQAIVQRLPVSPFLFPDDEISTQTVRFFVAELIRETVIEQFTEEIPYSTIARVEEFRESDDPLYIRATIYVERQSQKGILIGEGGAAIRRLGSAARAKIEEFLERRVYLDLWVKVLPKWRKSALELSRLGFPLPPDTKTDHA